MVSQSAYHELDKKKSTYPSLLNLLSSLMSLCRLLNQLILPLDANKTILYRFSRSLDHFGFQSFLLGLGQRFRLAGYFVKNRILPRNQSGYFLIHSGYP
jgi:hypothetical protein